MKFGCNLFCERKLELNKVANCLDIDKDKILFIEKNSDWEKYNDKVLIIIEYNGLLEEEDHELYAGYYYYDLSTSDERIFTKLEEFNIKDVVIDIG